MARKLRLGAREFKADLAREYKLVTEAWALEPGGA